MKVLIWGAGAIGGTLGAYFVRAGHGVRFVDMAAEHVEAVSQGGLSITGPIETFNVNVPAFTPAELTGQRQGWNVLKALRQAQLERV